VLLCKQGAAGSSPVVSTAIPYAQLNGLFKLSSGGWPPWRRLTSRSRHPALRSDGHVRTPLAVDEGSLTRLVPWRIRLPASETKLTTRPRWRVSPWGQERTGSARYRLSRTGIVTPWGRIMAVSNPSAASSR
jgi:hypothetical protein